MSVAPNRSGERRPRKPHEHTVGYGSYASRRDWVPAKRGVHRPGMWNSLEIESRNERIRVRLNGEVMAERPGDPARSKVGPIGLQLHDQFTWAMFRNKRNRWQAKPHHVSDTGEVFRLTQGRFSVPIGSEEISLA